MNYFFKIKDHNINWTKDPLALVVGKIKLNVTDASLEHDYYLYNKKKNMEIIDKYYYLSILKL